MMLFDGYVCPTWHHTNRDKPQQQQQQPIAATTAAVFVDKISAKQGVGSLFGVTTNNFVSVHQQWFSISIIN